MSVETVSLVAKFKQMIFEDNGYMVAKYIDTTTQEEVTVSGDDLPIAKKVSYKLWGSYKVYRKNNSLTLALHGYEVERIDTREEIIEYFIAPPYSLGKRISRKIYRKFGDDAIKIINNELSEEDLTLVDDLYNNRVYNEIFKGLKNDKKRYEAFEEDWNMYHKLYKVVNFLSKYGISRKNVFKLQKEVKKRFDCDIDTMLKSNPYFLMNMSYLSASLETCDEIAKALKFPRTEQENMCRVIAGIKHILLQGIREGHMYLSDRHTTQGKGLIRLTADKLRISPQEVSEGLRVDLRSNRPNFCIEKAKDGSYRIYLSSYYKQETNLAKKICKISNKKVKPIKTDKELDKFFDKYEKKEGITLADKQKEAVMSVSNNAITIITGGAGTGKTTVIKAILAMMKDSKLDDACLLAPTGKASRRMAEATGYEASTIHSRLGCGEDDDTFYNYDVECDTLVVDEVSMVDCKIAYTLFEALSTYKRVVLVGDPQQLPSVSAGNVLKDLIDSGRIPIVKLDVIQRQAHDNPIVANSQKVLHKENDFIFNNNFRFIEANTPSDAAEKLIREYTTQIEKEDMNNVQILIPMKKGICGAIAINKAIQEAINPSIRKERFRMADKVINLKNDKENNVSNGDIGYIESLIEHEEYTVVFESGERKTYYSSEFDNLALAHAITIHKSQGCEFPTILIPLIMEHKIMLYNNLLYTALTRGKENVILVGSHEALNIAIKTVRTINRNSKLDKRVQFG